MKKTNICLVFFLFLSISVFAQVDTGTGMSIWSSVEQTEEIVKFFENLFVSVGVVVKDTGEQFTCRHLGDRIEFEAGIGEVDYTVSIETYKVERLARFARTGEIAEEEQYRVLKEIFTPATAAVLKNPRLSTPFLKCVTGAEDVIHVVLKSPVATEEDVSHTLIYANRQWIVIAGLHGHAQRLYHLSLQDAITFQKATYRTINSTKCGRWNAYGRWYRRWRDEVSEKL